MRLHQLFSVDELKALDDKELEILRDAIRDEIASSPEILRIVKARAQGVYTQLKGTTTPKK
jgi:hypothetical protein